MIKEFWNLIEVSLFDEIIILKKVNDRVGVEIKYIIINI